VYLVAVFLISICKCSIFLKPSEKRLTFPHRTSKQDLEGLESLIGVHTQKYT
jgi:hypothetical protein